MAVINANACQAFCLTSLQRPVTASCFVLLLARIASSARLTAPAPGASAAADGGQAVAVAAAVGDVAEGWRVPRRCSSGLFSS